MIAVNPYDYGRWSGNRRSSLLANVLFTAMLWPAIGPIVARSGNRWVLRHVLGHFASLEKSDAVAQLIAQVV